MSTSQSAAAPHPARRRFTRPVPVSVNGVVIPSAAIARETQHHQASDPDQAWMLAAQALAIRELLSQEAERLSIVAEPIEDGEGRRETPHEARLRALIERAGLPVRGPVIDAADNAGHYIEHMRLDKKAVGGDIQFVVIDGPGQATVCGAPDAMVRDVINACCA